MDKIFVMGKKYFVIDKIILSRTNLILSRTKNVLPGQMDRAKNYFVSFEYVHSYSKRPVTEKDDPFFMDFVEQKCKDT